MHYLSALMREFVEKSSLPRHCEVEISHTRSGDSCISIDDPVVVARFYSFVKSRAHDDEVFVRGQTADYPGLRPSLFRGCDDQAATVRAAAYSDLIKQLNTVLGHNRFRRTNIGALLQHYGLRTPWIDLVDNLFVATWFARHRYDPETHVYVRSKEPHGWLTLVAATSEHGAFPCIDLRKHHSSMNTRLQAQHGLSAAAQHDGMPVTTFEYDDQVVARIRFPNSRKFSLAGKFFQASFLFPKPSLDETYDIILQSKINRLVSEVENQFGLPDAALGRVTRLRYRVRRAPRNVP